MPTNLSKTDTPDMPAGYGLQADTEAKIKWDWVEDHLEKSRNYWICSSRPDGRPHAMPVWCVWVAGSLYFATDRDSLKARNLAANPQVVIHLESGDEVVILEGLIQEEKDPDRLADMARAYNIKYPGYYFDPTARSSDVTFVLHPLKAMAWTEKSFPNDATRWRFQPQP